MGRVLTGNWGYIRHVNYARVKMMPAATMHEKIQRSSAAGQPAPSHSQPPVYHSNTAPKRTLSSKPHLASKFNLSISSGFSIPKGTVSSHYIPSQTLRTAHNTRRSLASRAEIICLLHLQ